MRVNISTVSCSYNEWFRIRAEDLLFLATFESVMKKDDVGTVFCIMHLEPAPNGIVRLSPVAKLCTNHPVISRHLRRHSGGDLDQRLWPLLSFLLAAVFHPRFVDTLCLADFGRRVNSEERLQRYCNRLSFVLTPPQIILLRETSKTCSAFDTEKKASD